MSPAKILAFVVLPVTVGAAVGVYSLAAYARKQTLARGGRTRIFFDRDGAADGRTYEADVFEDWSGGTERYCARFLYSPGWTAPVEVFDQCVATYEAAQELLRAQYERAGFPTPFE